MGNLCGKQSESDAFSTPGRTLASAPAPSNNKIASVPKRVGGPPRTLGGATTNTQTPEGAEPTDASRKAAAAAEARANAVGGKPKGKLSSQLQEQKRQTRGDTLDQASRDELRARDADAGAETRAYN